MAQEAVLVSELYPELRYYPLNGKVYYQDYIQIKGTAFLMGEDWMKGDIILYGGQRINNISIKLDVYAHRVLVYQEYLKRIISIDKRDIREFWLKDTQLNRKFVFFSGFPTKAKPSDGCYFEALAEGRLSLYKLHYKDVLPLTAPEMPLLDEFLDEKGYYLKDGEEFLIIRLRKIALLKLYPEYKSELKQFIRKNNLHVKHEKDFIIVVTHLSNVIELIESSR